MKNLFYSLFTKRMNRVLSVFSLWALLTAIAFNSILVTPLAFAGDPFEDMNPPEAGGVLLVDNDGSFEGDDLPGPEEIAGLNGLDFMLMWTPEVESQPAGFKQYKIIIVPSGTTVALDGSNVTCGGEACAQIFNGPPWYNQRQYMLEKFQRKDSLGNDFSDTEYIAYVLIDADTSVLLGPSNPMVPEIEEDVADTNPPFINHRNASKYISGQQLTLYAQIFDNGTEPEEFTNEAYVRMYYGGGSSNNINNNYVSGTLVDGTDGAWQFQTNETFTSDVYYYFKVVDKAGNTQYFTSSGEFNMNFEEGNDPSPYAFKVVPYESTPGNLKTLSGTMRVMTDGVTAGEEGVFVILMGLAVPGITTSGDGSYSFSVPQGNYELMATKEGFCPSNYSVVVGSVTTVLNANLQEGFCMMGGDGAPNQGPPHKIFSLPIEGSQNQPVDPIIRVGFDQPMSDSSIDDLSTNIGDNVYLLEFSNSSPTNIPGSVIYCENNRDEKANCNLLPSQDQRVLVFVPNENLSPNKSYALEITERVKSENGQSVQGNRPGGGHKIGFGTGGGSYNYEEILNQIGQSGQYMRPVVMKMAPKPGEKYPSNINLFLYFDQSMDSTTINSDNFVLYKVADSLGSPVSTPININVSLDDSDRSLVKIDPNENLSAGEYEVRVFCGAKSASGIPIGDLTNPAQVVFKSNIFINGTVDSVSPQISMITNPGEETVPVNEVLKFKSNEALDSTTVIPANITFLQGSSSIPFDVQYDSFSKMIFVIPNSILFEGSAHTITFGEGITNIAGTALEETGFSFETGGFDEDAPRLIKADCNDFSCTAYFSEPMNHSPMPMDSNENALITDEDGYADWTKSVLNSQNFALWSADSYIGEVNLLEVDLDEDTLFSYNPIDFSITIKNFSDFVVGKKFKLIAADNNKVLTDLSGNELAKVDEVGSSVNIFIGIIGDATMVNNEVKNEMNGDYWAYPFNKMENKDVNVFQVGFVPGIEIENGDFVYIGFDRNAYYDSNLSDVAQDTYSPFMSDFNQEGSGTVTFDDAYGEDGITYDSVTKSIVIKLDISENLDPDAPIMMDLRNIINPAPGSYDVDISIKRDAEILATYSTDTSPYTIGSGGENSITLNFYAGDSEAPDDVSGEMFFFGGGPMGPLDTKIEFSNGIATEEITNAADGCYFISTQPFINLSNNDYFGSNGDQVCVGPNNSEATKNIVLSAANDESSLPLTVKFDVPEGFSFEGRDVEIFAGGPNNFVVRTLENLGQPNADGYTLRLPSNGQWNVGVGPAMSKGASSSFQEPLPGNPPPPVEIKVSGLGTDSATIARGFMMMPAGTNLNTATKTLTLTFEEADKTISGKVVDGAGTGLSNVEVFANSMGFGAPSHTMTKSDGTFTLNVAKHGNFELGANRWGLPPKFVNIELKMVNENDVVYYKGKAVGEANPLIIKLKKPDYYVEGKILDASGNAIPHAPVSVVNQITGEFIPGGGTSQDGSYRIFVDNGTYTLKSELPPDKTDSCVTLSRTVVVDGANKTNQNIVAEEGTCYTISGQVLINDEAQPNMPVFIEEWNTETNRPIGGFFRPTGTDSDGTYTALVAGDATYRIGTFHPENGEVSITLLDVTGNLVNPEDGSTDLNFGTLENINFEFTGATDTMNGFIELKNSSDEFNRMGKPINYLEEGVVMSTQSGTYEYFVNIDGIGFFEGEVLTGSTITIDLSDRTLVTLSGIVTDDEGTLLQGAQITATTTSESGETITQTVKTNSVGEYEMNVEAGAYTLKPSLSGYVLPAIPEEVEITEDIDYNFGTIGENAGEQPALERANMVISGNIETAEGTVVTDAYVTAVNEDGVRLPFVPVESDGTYELPVIKGTWTLESTTSLFDKYEGPEPIKVINEDVADQDIIIDNDEFANEDKSIATTSSSLMGNVGGSIDDTDNTGVKLNIGAGVATTSTDNVLVNIERNFTAPDTASFDTLCNAAFDISASTDSAIKNLNGNAEIQINYGDLIDLGCLPEDFDETELKLAYESPETGEYKLVEGGFAVDKNHNTISGQVNHFTNFAIVYAAQLSDGGDPPAGDDDDGGSLGGSIMKKTVIGEGGAEKGAGLREIKFTDISTHWAKEYIEDLYLKGIVNGYSETRFEPIKPITRAEFTKIAVKMFEIAVPTDLTSSSFSDVNATDWFAPYLEAAKINGLIVGYKDGTFKPREPITRAAAVKILVAAATGFDPETFYPDHFSDVPGYMWYAPYVNYANLNGIVEGFGDGTFKPTRNITRAEAAKIVSLMLKNGYKLGTVSMVLDIVK